MSPQEEKPHQKPIRKYLIFSGIAIEMIIVIFLGAWVGDIADDYVKNETPILVLVMMLVGVAISIFILLKRIKNL